MVVLRLRGRSGRRVGEGQRLQVSCSPVLWITTMSLLLQQYFSQASLTQDTQNLPWGGTSVTFIKTNVILFLDLDLQLLPNALGDVRVTEANKSELSSPRQYSDSQKAEGSHFYTGSLLPSAFTSSAYFRTAFQHWTLLYASSTYILRPPL